MRQRRAKKAAGVIQQLQASADALYAPAGYTEDVADDAELHLHQRSQYGHTEHQQRPVAVESHKQSYPVSQLATGQFCIINSTGDNFISREKSGNVNSPQVCYPHCKANHECNGICAQSGTPMAVTR